MKIKIQEKDKAFFNKFLGIKSIEDDFIFRLKNLGVEYNSDINLHRQVYNDLASGSINIEVAINIMTIKYVNNKNKKNKFKL
jgi:hypothetical protein